MPYTYPMREPRQLIYWPRNISCLWLCICLCLCILFPCEPGYGFVRKYDKITDSFLVNKSTCVEFYIHCLAYTYFPTKLSLNDQTLIACLLLSLHFEYLFTCGAISSVLWTPRTWGLSLIQVLSPGCSINIYWMNWFLEVQLPEAQFVNSDRYLRANPKTWHRGTSQQMLNQCPNILIAQMHGTLQRKVCFSMY